MPAVVRTLHDIASTLESSDRAIERIRHVLGLLREIVAYDQCGLLEVRPGAADRLIALPELTQPRMAALTDALAQLLTRVSDGTLGSRLSAMGAPPGPLGWSSRLAVPLVGLDQVIGLLFVGHTAADNYTERDLTLLSLVGSRLAAYLTCVGEQADRIAATQTIDELRDLQDFTDAALTHTAVDELLHDLLERLHDRLAADALSVVLVIDGGQYLAECVSLGLPRELESARIPLPTELAQRVSSGEYVSGAELSSLEVACAPFRESFPSLLGAPLVSRGRLIGILLAGSRQADRFAEHDARLVRLVGDRVASPLEHALLHEEAQRALARADAAQRRLALLGEVATALTASLDYEGSLQSVAHLMVPVLGDVCLVDIVEPDGELRPVALASVEPSAEDEIRQSRAQHPVTLNSAHAIASVLRSGRPQVYHAVPDLLHRWVGGTDPTTGRAYDIKSALVIPLVARGRPLGTMTCASVLAQRYQPADVALAEQVGRRVAAGVDNGRLYREAQAAEARYRRLLSKQLKTLPPRTRSTADRLEHQPERSTSAVEAAVPSAVDVVQAPLHGMPLTPLTPREQDVLRLLVAGASTRDIARRLVVSEYAVRYHLRNLFLKLDVHSRTQLVAQVLHLGLARTG